MKRERKNFQSRRKRCKPQRINARATGRSWIVEKVDWWARSANWKSQRGKARWGQRHYDSSSRRQKDEISEPINLSSMHPESRSRLRLKLLSDWNYHKIQYKNPIHSQSLKTPSSSLSLSHPPSSSSSNRETSSTSTSQENVLPLVVSLRPRIMPLFKSPSVTLMLKERSSQVRTPPSLSLVTSVTLEKPMIH